MTFDQSSNLVTYIGVDLAWSPRNRSGVAVLRGTPQGAWMAAEPYLLDSNAEIVDWITEHCGDGPSIVAIDAPLLVPNEHGRREAEAALSAAFRYYEAGAHPANRRLLARDGVVRGEVVTAALTERGFRYATEIAAGMQERVVCEVFPHPAMIAIFGLQRTLKYKAKPQRPEALRLEAWRRYQALLRDLVHADPPIHGHEDVLALDPASLRPTALKAYEDRVDALFCAYIALYLHRWGGERCRSFGDPQRGTIITPVPEEMR